jgi:hypothetical protein
VNTDVVLRDVDTPQAYAEALGMLSHRRSLSCEQRTRYPIALQMESATCAPLDMTSK